MLGNESGWVDYVLSSAGILFVGSILLLAIGGVFRLTIPTNEQILLQDVASEIDNRIKEVDLKSFPYKHSFRLKEGGYIAEISSEYVAVSFSNRSSNHARALMTCIYPARNSFWNNTSEMRLFLEEKFGADGSPSHRIDSANASNLSGLFSDIAMNASLHPVRLERDKQIWLEKEFIYFDDCERRGYVFVFQE